MAYQTAYLKANFPSEYMAALLSSNLNNIGTLTTYMSECKHMGIKVMGPDVNESMQRFSSNKQGDIRFGLAAIKGVGEAAALSIIEEREKNGNYKDIYDFFERVNYSVVNRKCLENIAYAGGFDSLCDISRCKFFAPDERDASGLNFIEQMMRYGQRFIAEKLNAQQSLFGGGLHVDLQRPTVPVCAEWHRLVWLNKEKDVIGMYLSEHPLDEYKLILQKMCNTSISQMNDLAALDGKEIVIAGVVTAVQHLTTSDGKQQFGVMTVEDYSGEEKFRLYGKDYERFRPMMFEGYYLLIRGRVVISTFYKKEDVNRENPTTRIRFNISTMTQLNEVAESIKALTLTIPTEMITKEFIASLTSVAKHSRGTAALNLQLNDLEEGVGLKLHAKKRKVKLTEEFKEFIEQYNLEYDIA